MNSGNYESVENLTYQEDGYYHLLVPTFYEYGDNANRIVDFVFDTGAFLTIINRKTAEVLRCMERFTIHAGISLDGFSGSCLADIKEIPGFVIGGRRLESVKVAVPHIDTDMSILGLNVLEQLKYLIDTENDRIYFSTNPKPEIPEALRTGKIYKFIKDTFYALG